LVSSLDHVAHDDAADLRRVELSAFQRFTHHRRAELGRGNAFKRAVERADGRAYRLTENDFTRTHSRLLFQRFLRIANTRHRSLGGSAQAGQCRASEAMVARLISRRSAATAARFTFDSTDPSAQQR